jgi:tRNA-splicing ligase RtcB
MARKKVVVHRRGATRAFLGQPVLIPGSMGTGSDVLVGRERAMEESFGSSCPGAGRTMSRKRAKCEIDAPKDDNSHSFSVSDVTPSGIHAPHIAIMTEFLNERLVPDAPTLRRIAVLVMRASQDDEALRRPMDEIWHVIEQLKRDVARGLPLDRDNVVRLSSLIERLARRRAFRGERTVQTSILVELHDLGRTLCAGVPDCCH